MHLFGLYCITLRQAQCDKLIYFNDVILRQALHDISVTYSYNPQQAIVSLS
jgi:hypothetical protein